MTCDEMKCSLMWSFTKSPDILQQTWTTIIRSK